MPRSRSDTEWCEGCLAYRKLVKRRKLWKNFHCLCPICIQDIKLTTKCMEVSTDCFMKKFGQNYEKVTNISVRPLMPTS